MPLLPSPKDMGLTIEDYRPEQVPVIQWALNPDPTTKAQVLVADTGWGKSVLELATAYGSGLQTYMLTVTKPLQQQLLRLDPALHIIMGQANYGCRYEGEDPPERNPEPLITVADAQCQSGWHCPIRDECYYYGRKLAVPFKRATSMNYSVYLTDRRYVGDFPAPPFLIADEAHRAEEQLLSAMTLPLVMRELTAFKVTHPPKVLADIPGWASTWEPKVREQKRELEQVQASGQRLSSTQMDRLKRARSLHQTLVDIIEHVADDNWVMEEATPQVRVLKPIFATPFGDLLWGGAGRILCMSATIPDVAYFAKSVGLPRYEARTLPAVFDPSRRPVYLDTISSWLSHKTINYSPPSRAVKELLARIDDILGRRPGQKGIIHTPSWSMAGWIAGSSKHRRRMVLPGGRADQRQIIDAWESHAPDAVLVSPSVYEGVDLPYHLNEFQILPKLPWPNRSSAAVNARLKHDREYEDYSTVLRVVQTVGRVMRQPDDRGETWILDPAIKGLLDRRGDWFAPGFHAAIRPAPERRFGMVVQ